MYSVFTIPYVFIVFYFTIKIYFADKCGMTIDLKIVYFPENIFIEGGSSVILITQCYVVIDIIPVSYTHLDVYKRQERI